MDVQVTLSDQDAEYYGEHTKIDVVLSPEYIGEKLGELRRSKVYIHNPCLLEIIVHRKNGLVYKDECAIPMSTPLEPLYMHNICVRVIDHIRLECPEDANEIIQQIRASACSANPKSVDRLAGPSRYI